MSFINSRDVLALQTIRLHNLTEQQYYELLRKSAPDKGYSYFEVLDEDLFFEWCDKNGFECSGQEILLPVNEIKDVVICIARYDYGPEVGYVVFSYN